MVRLLRKKSEAVPENGWIYNSAFRDSILDDYLSVRGLKRLSREIMGEEMDGKRLSELCSEKNPGALKVYREFGKILYEGILPFLDSFKPQALILGGQITKSFPYFGEKLEKACKERSITLIMEENTSLRAMQGLHFLRKTGGMDMILNREKGAPPLYSQVETILRTDIEHGKYNKGDSFPTENMLMEEYQVSRVTIRQAMTALSQAGYIMSRRGIGTEVTYEKIDEHMKSVISFTDEMKQHNITMNTSYCKMEKNHSVHPGSYGSGNTENRFLLPAYSGEECSGKSAGLYHHLSEMCGGTAAG